MGTEATRITSVTVATHPWGYRRVVVSLITPVRGRLDHLAGLAAGIRDSDPQPYEWIVSWMGGPDPTATVKEGDVPFRIIEIEGEETHLSRARNEGARAARHDLVFLDVDCIPAPVTFHAYSSLLDGIDRIICGRTLYLPPGCGTKLDEMNKTGRMHPAQTTLYNPPLSLDREHALFWSLNFGIRAKTFWSIGGFDEGYVGYGFEDTDFAFRARQIEVGMARASEALAFHQNHPPSYSAEENLGAIIRNARLFREKWDEWPAIDWLDQLRRDGLIQWDPGSDLLQPLPRSA